MFVYCQRYIKFTFIRVYSYFISFVLNGFEFNAENVAIKL
jgi:hypothetical protein